MISVRISDVRQYTFCQRVIWHRLVMGQTARETPKMEMGRQTEEALARLEKRRRLRRYGLDGATRRFGVSLRSEALGVHGVCDLVLEPTATTPPGAPVAAVPVEVKTTRGGVGRHHVLQLAGYAMLLEEEGSAPIGRGFVLLLPEDKVEAVRLGELERDGFRRAVESIRMMIETQRFPEPTRYRSFCPDCEYVNFCGDVL